MSGGTVLVVVLGLLLALLLGVAARVDVQARRRGSRLVSGANMAQAIKEAKQEARARRGLHHLGGSGRRPSGRPSWDDREG